MDYWYWDNLLSTEEIVEINNVCKNNIDSSLVDRPASGVVKTSKVEVLEWRYLQPNFEKIYEAWMTANRDTFGYNLYPVMNNELWHYNTYDSINSAEYGCHKDEDNKRVSDIKLTGIVNISDEPYEGGEFIVFKDDTFREIPEISQPGCTLLLNQGIVHKVNPVTKGIRKTLSFWFYGPVHF
tara:strand:+ start:100 stop:645 length:546 start_codon:yes stop_codon:yes gene_type:complete